MKRWQIIGFVVCMLALSAQAQAGQEPPLAALPNNECDLTSACYTDTGPLGANGGTYYYWAANSPTPPNLYVGARSVHGSTASGAMDLWGTCRYVDNISPRSSIFVPFNSALEWTQFVSNVPPSIIKFRDCSLAMADNVKTDPDGTCKPAQSQQVILPYTPYPDPNTGVGTVITKNLTFNCKNADGSTWQETATATYQGNDVKTDFDARGNPNPGWAQVSLTYGQTPINGTCGDATKNPVQSPPISNLCSAGTASATVETPDHRYFNWTCQGAAGGIDAQCQTIYAPQIMAGCMVDTNGWDTFGFGSCEGQGCSDTNDITFAVGTIMPGDTPYLDDPAGARYQTTWTPVNPSPNCSQVTNPDGSWCWYNNIRNGQYAMQVSVKDTLTGQVSNFTINASKFTAANGPLCQMNPP